MGVFDARYVKDYTVRLSSGNYGPGDVVRGTISFTITQEVGYRSVCFKVIGRERTQIMAVGSGPSRMTSSNKRNFFKVYVTLLGHPKYGDGVKETRWKGTLVPGTYSFPFSVRLPLDVVPSMVASRTKGIAVVGSADQHAAPPVDQDCAVVEYFVKSTIDVHLGADSVATAPFTVTTAMPAAQLAALSYPSPARDASLTTSTTRHHPKSCFFFSNGLYRATLTCDQPVLVLSGQGQGGPEYGRGQQGDDDDDDGADASCISGHFTVDNSEGKKPLGGPFIVSITALTAFSASNHKRRLRQTIASTRVDGLVAERCPTLFESSFTISLEPTLMPNPMEGGLNFAPAHTRDPNATSLATMKKADLNLNIYSAYCGASPVVTTDTCASKSHSGKKVAVENVFCEKKDDGPEAPLLASTKGADHGATSINGASGLLNDYKGGSGAAVGVSAVGESAGGGAPVPFSPFVPTFKGWFIQHSYLLTLSSGTVDNVIAEVAVPGTFFIDGSDTCVPVTDWALLGTTVRMRRENSSAADKVTAVYGRGGEYPRFMYAPPPYCEALVPKGQSTSDAALNVPQIPY